MFFKGDMNDLYINIDMDQSPWYNVKQKKQHIEQCVLYA